MTATRDDRGRFVSQNVAAADLLLKTAVRHAARIFAEPPTEDGPFMADKHRFVVTMLAEAGRSAELLLDGGAK